MYYITIMLSFPVLLNLLSQNLVGIYGGIVVDTFGC